MTKPRKPSVPLTITQEACLVDGSDTEFRKLIHAMLAFSARLLSVRDGFGALISLTGIQYSTLVSIAHHQDKARLTVNRVANHLHLSGAFVTIETGKLQKLGLITKTPNPEDKREILLAATPAGLDLLKRLAPDQQRINDVLFQSITRKEFEAMRSLFDRLVDNGDRANIDLSHLIARQTKG